MGKVLLIFNFIILLSCPGNNCWITTDNVNIFLGQMPIQEAVMSNNVEYTETINKRIFEFLVRNPRKFIRALDTIRTSDEVKYRLILREVESPLGDGTDIDDLSRALSKVKCKSPAKRDLLKSLEKAAEKSITWQGKFENWHHYNADFPDRKVYDYFNNIDMEIHVNIFQYDKLKYTSHIKDIPLFITSCPDTISCDSGFYICQNEEKTVRWYYANSKYAGDFLLSNNTAIMRSLYEMDLPPFWSRTGVTPRTLELYYFLNGKEIKKKRDAYKLFTMPPCDMEHRIEYVDSLGRINVFLETSPE